MPPKRLASSARSSPSTMPSRLTSTGNPYSPVSGWNPVEQNPADFENGQWMTMHGQVVGLNCDFRRGVVEVGAFQRDHAVALIRDATHKSALRHHAGSAVRAG